jgi:hypothetical protein
MWPSETLDGGVQADELLVGELVKPTEVDIVRGAAWIFIGQLDPKQLFEFFASHHSDSVPRISRTGLRTFVASDAFIEPDLNRRHIVMDATVVSVLCYLLGR